MKNLHEMFIESGSLRKMNTVDDSFKANGIPKGRNSKFYILPDGQVINLGNQWHYEYIINNIKKLKKYGIVEDEIKKSPTEQNVRLYALSKGLTRMNYEVNGGHLTIEAPYKWIGRKLRDEIKTFVFDNVTQIDKLTLLLLDESGTIKKNNRFNWNITSTDNKMFEIEDMFESLIK